MGKKSKEKQETQTQPSSDIFKSLFSNPNSDSKSNEKEEEEKKQQEGKDNLLSSLFSNNPYRRKPQQSTLTLNSQNPPTIQTQSIPDSNHKKRERKQLSGPDDSDLDTAKKTKQRIAIDAHIERTDEESAEISVEKKKKKKKKRKRDEIEEEYEVRKYGGENKKDEKKPVVGEKRKAADESSGMVLSKDGFDDDSKLQRTVFVGNLPLSIKRKALLKEFKQFGEVESIRIRSVPIVDSKKPRKGAIMEGKINDSADSVHAYIVFKDEQSVQASLAHNLARVGDKHIRVDRACPPRKKLKGENAPLYDIKRTVFVGNLPFDVKDEELYQLFSGVNNLESSLEAIRVIRDANTHLGKGIAYILFKTRDAANSVVRIKNLHIRDRHVRVSRAKSDPTPPSKKRKNSVPATQGDSRGKRLAVESADTSTSNGKPQVKAPSLSYQGLRASKSGVQKKVNLHPSSEVRTKSVSTRLGGKEQKARSSKRPAVAARKEKAKRLGARSVGGSASHLGKKRKLEAGTPESSDRNKKARKFK